ncbi:hypothetical protein [Massilia pseudoviolaceinigra]|uniref:hypothetical protein n=1 Tax=Massilia pseudoviolaceinigra TaxID=3057165 RepID=UPI002796CBC4|nr:hypothetical protein [Massilia sp. CCM 9206]MDQ1921669.1 hypothetical protein [Massilia sp. CCM 9206]
MSAPTDRELLELAAKAVGIVGEYRTAHQAYGDQFVDGIDTGARFWWNPLADVGDRYRLAQTLGMNIDFADCFVWKRTPTGVIQEFWGADYAGDDDAHAIVRLAAEIGLTQ